MNFRRHRVMVATRSWPAQRSAAPPSGTRAYTAVVSGVLRPLNSPLHGMHAYRHADPSVGWLACFKCGWLRLGLRAGGNDEDLRAQLTGVDPQLGP